MRVVLCFIGGPPLIWVLLPLGLLVVATSVSFGVGILGVVFVVWVFVIIVLLSISLIGLFLSRSLAGLSWYSLNLLRRVVIVAVIVVAA